jgi:quercetin dioxygenase-like cupin family protein
MALAGALIGGACFASDSIDAVAVAPNEFRILLENDSVRVLEYEIRPGQQEPWHTHPPKVSYVLAGGRLRITPKLGAPFDITETVGEASWMASLGPHRAENIGTTPVRILLVEVKSAASAAASIAGAGETIPR